MITLLVGIQFSKLIPAGEMTQRSGLTPSETARDQIGMLRGECSECCARSFRNPARHQLGTVRTIISESAEKAIKYHVREPGRGWDGWGEIEVALQRCKCYGVAGLDAILIHSKRDVMPTRSRHSRGHGGSLAPAIIVPTTYASAAISSGNSRLPERPEGLASLLRAIASRLLRR
ncbi:hypothetical protein [Bradyrhizobium cenepequi]|uniref:hypothetical protein n=1 Tax=Bradyrhizobium cenepequi TaxID=2821403 RepID=UPI001CE29C75|nr:hypothetical protein [Bradyrhizobium cenepequi]MCA6112861.1 hypothetical protein [Bradyrhizobium cenepequi]